MPNLVLFLSLPQQKPETVVLPCQPSPCRFHGCSMMVPPSEGAGGLCVRRAVRASQLTTVYMINVWIITFLFFLLQLVLLQVAFLHGLSYLFSASVWRLCWRKLQSFISILTIKVSIYIFLIRFTQITTLTEDINFVICDRPHPPVLLCLSVRVKLS